jgi:hypothetical protein
MGTAAFLLCGLVAGQPGPTLTLQQVLRANTAAGSSIRSIHVTIEVDNKLPMQDSTPTEPVPTYVKTWYKDGEEERVRTEWKRGPQPHNSDAYNGAKGYKWIQDYDPSFDPPLSESIARPASGEIGPTFPERSTGLDPRGHCWWLYDLRGKLVTLEEFAGAVSGSRLRATPATSPAGCYEILVPAPERDMVFFVDPAAGFWIRRVEGGPEKEGPGAGNKASYVAEVEEFTDCGNGIFFPRRAATTTILADGQAKPFMRFRYTVHSLNQPLPPEDFQVKFVDWLRVLDRGSGEYHVWGPDDKPRLSFANQKKYLEWYRPVHDDPYRVQDERAANTAWWKKVAYWIAGCLTLVGVSGLVLLRRRKPKSA